MAAPGPDIASPVGLIAGGGALPFAVADSLADPLEDLGASALTLANTMDGIRKAGGSPVLIIPSSAAVYGNPAKLPVSESGAIDPIFCANHAPQMIATCMMTMRM